MIGGKQGLFASMNSPAALDEEGDVIYITAGNVEMLYGLETRTGTFSARERERGCRGSVCFSPCLCLCFFCVSVHGGQSWVNYIVHKSF